MTKSPTPRPDGSERIAKAIARAGLASRRDAEAIIEAGRVTVNGKTVGVATNVLPSDRIIVDGKPLPSREGARLWLYHKPSGLVTTERDEKGRNTVFDAVRGELGRVLSVGRLDLTSEGLLLLTNDGDLKRQLELPETGWLRRYRVRVNGHPSDAAMDRLRKGIEVDGEAFAPMQVSLDRTVGANAWLTIGLREGRNREIRRAMEAVGLIVARLIRVSYGPFQLGKLALGKVEELRPKILKDQLGGIFDGELADGKRAPQETDMSEDKPHRGKPAGKGAPRRDAKPGAKPGGKPARKWEDRPPRKDGERPARDGDSPKRGGKPFGGPKRGGDFKRDDRAQSAGRPDTRRDGEDTRTPDERKAARAEHKQRVRDDPSASIRRGGLRGGATKRGPAKRDGSGPGKKPGGKHPKGKPSR